MSKSKIARWPFNVKKLTLDFSKLYTNIIEPSSTNNIAARELQITGVLNFENCNKTNKRVHVRFFFVIRLK
jgi:hypothetical protein